MKTIAYKLVILLMSFTFHLFKPAMANEISLKEKIGQMLIVGFQGTELDDQNEIKKLIEQQKIGGVILFDYDLQKKVFGRNITSPEQLKKLTQQLQSEAKEAARINQNSLYPLFISIDYEGGAINRLKEKNGFPATISAAKIGQGSDEQATLQAEQMAETLQEAGVNLNYAPVVDVNINTNNPIISRYERSFSADPQEVVKFASIFSKAFQEHGILCTYKHFPGHGSSTGDTHKEFVDVTNTLQTSELEVYQQLFQKEEQCPLVMAAHVIHYGLDNNGYPASLSSATIKNILRNRLNFQGVVISDDMQMKAISDHYGLKESVRLAINAGVNILIFGNQLITPTSNTEELINMIYDDVISGEIDRNQIDESYDRIMKLKQKLIQRAANI